MTPVDPRADILQQMPTYQACVAASSRRLQGHRAAAYEGDGIRYLGDIGKDVENREGPAVGLHESYSFSETGGVTTLAVELQVPDQWTEDLRGMWSEAIVTIKRLAGRARSTKS